MQQNSIKIVSDPQRALLVIPALLLLFGADAAFCWFFGNSLATNAQQPEVAATAVFVSSADALAHARLAYFKTSSFVPADVPEALHESELAAALSPNDYRYWFALARMRERTGDAEGAESAAHRAAELAPNYAEVLWLNGNILLRRGRQTEAFTEMRRAAEADPQFAIYFVNAVAQSIKTDDPAVWRQIVGDNSAVRIALMKYLAQNKDFVAATDVWQELPDTEKRGAGKDLAKALLEAKKYRAALSIFQFMTTNEAEKPILGHFLNGDFENDIATADSNPFVWQIAAGAQPQIAPFASTRHGGERSLIVFFSSSSSADFRNVSQTVAIESNVEYHFETWVKAEKLQSASTGYWEVIDAIDGRVLSKTTNVPSGDHDWQKLTTNFRTRDAAEAIMFRFVRAACSEPLCLISGKIWFDDFTLEKIDK